MWLNNAATSGIMVNPAVIPIYKHMQILMLDTFHRISLSNKSISLFLFYSITDGSWPESQSASVP